MNPKYWRLKIFLVGILGVISCLSAAPTWAQPPLELTPEARKAYKTARMERVRQSTQKLQSLQTLEDRINAARERKAALLELMEVAPEEVLSLMLPDAIRSSLPSEVKPYMEKNLQKEGTLEVLIEDWPDRSIMRYSLTTKQGKRYTLHFAGEPPSLLSGTHVRIQGIALDQEVALKNSEPISQETSLKVLQAAALTDATGEQKTIGILVNFQDDQRQPATPAGVHKLIFDTTTGVNAYYYENSYQQTWLSGTVVGWYTLPISVGTTCPSQSSVFNEAIKAADPVVYFPDYSRIVVMFQAPCGWGGVGTIGKTTVSTADGPVTASQAWINGSFKEITITAHELGHNLGVYHANALDCGTEIIAPTGCTQVEYGDPFDVMGSSASNHFNAAQKDRLGWFSTNNVLALTSEESRIYPLAPVETPSAGLQTLKVLKEINLKNERAWYYIENREAIGFDADLASNPSVISGALVHIGYDTAPYVRQSQLLDMTPQSQETFRDAALPVGQTFTDPAGIMMTNSGNRDSTLDIAITVPPDRTPPHITTSIPDFVEGLVGIYFEGSDNRGITQIQLYKDGALLATSQTPPFSMTWDTTDDAEGPHNLTAKAYDMAGNEGSSEKTVKVDHNPPILQITSPRDGDVVSGVAEFKGEITDAVGLKRVDVMIDGILNSSIEYQGQLSVPFNFFWNTSTTTNGIHTFTVQVIDMAWHITGANIRVTVSNHENYPPVLNPIGNQNVQEGQTLSFSISATDPDGNPLTYSASPLPSGATFDSTTGVFTWTPTYTHAGTYPVTFTVSDGELTDSEVVTITVTDTPMPDLTITALSGPTSAYRGMKITVNTTVRNQGSAASNGFSVGLYLSPDATITSADRKLGAWSLTGLAAGTSTSTSLSIRVPLSIPAGPYYLGAIADATGLIKESDETNNSKAENIIRIK